MAKDEYDDDDSSYEEVYIDMFGDHKKKDTRIGTSFQASSIPLVTDIQYYEYL